MTMASLADILYIVFVVICLTVGTHGQAVYTSSGTVLPTVSPSSSGQMFTSVAVDASGFYCVAGAPTDNGGAVEIFVKSNTTGAWNNTQKITSPCATCTFGTSVAMAGNPLVMVVGAPTANSGNGYTYVYTQSSFNSSWVLAQRLVGSGGSAAAQGTSVAVDSNASRIVVGGPSNGGGNGAVWVFTYVTPGNYILEANISAPSGGASGSNFGAAVSLSFDSTALAVGAPLDGTCANNAGVAWMFTRSSTAWVVPGGGGSNPMQRSSCASGDNFGLTLVALPLSQKRVFVGAPNAAGRQGSPGKNAGYVGLFALSGTSWSETVMTPSTISSSGSYLFGTSMSLGLDVHNTFVVVVGSPGTSNTAGNTWVFTSNGTTASQREIITPSSSCSGCQIGSSVAVNSAGANTAIVGANLALSSLGEGFAFYDGCLPTASMPVQTGTLNCSAYAGFNIIAPAYSNCTFGCAPGYLPLPGGILKYYCQNHTWNKWTTANPCAPAVCTRPADTASVIFSTVCNQTYPWGGQCTGTCASGYNLAGSLLITCTNGAFTAVSGSCNLPTGQFSLLTPANYAIVPPSNRGPSPTFNVTYSWGPVSSWGCTSFLDFCTTSTVYYDTNLPLQTTSPNYGSAKVSNTAFLTGSNCPTSINITMPKAGTYYWYVSQTSGCSNTYQSTSTFQFCDSTYPQPVTLQQVPNGVSTPQTMPTFQWSTPTMGVGCTAVSSTVSIYIDTVSPPVALAATLAGTATTYTPVTDLVVGQTYYWNVVLSNGQYAVTVPASGSPPSFTVCAPQYPIVPNLLLPANNGYVQAVSYAVVKLKWNSTFYETCGYQYSNQYQVFLSNASSSGPFVLVGTFPAGVNSTAVNQTVGVYYWYVVAQNKGGFTSQSATNVFQICNSIAPQPPTLSSPANATTGLGASVTLSWAPSSDFGTVCLGATQTNTYTVYFGTSYPPTSVLSTQSTTSIVLNSLTGSPAVYYWAVAASNGQTQTSSPVWSFQVCIPQVPGQSRPLTPASGSVNVLPPPTLSWSAASFGNACGTPSTYQVFFDTVNPPAALTTTYPSTTTSATITGLADGVYYWMVQTFNGATTSGVTSAVSNFTTCTPSVPSSNVTLTFPLNGQQNIPPAPSPVLLQWTSESFWGNLCAKNSSANIYRIYLDNRTTPVTLVGTVVDTGATSYSFAVNLTSNTYYWYVQMVGMNGLAAATGVSTFTVNVVCVPVAPTPATLSLPASGTLSSTNAALSWSPGNFGVCCGGGQANTYNVLLDTSATPATTVTPSPLTSSQLSYTVSGLPTNAHYYWAVNISNGCVWTLSTVGDFCVPTAPSLVTPTSPQSGALNLPTTVSLGWAAPASWGDSQGCAAASETYTLFLSLSNPPTTVVSSGIAGGTTSLSYTAAVAGTYFWKVGASNGIQDNSASSVVSNFTVCIVTPPGLPTLVTPLNGSINQDPIGVTLQWNAANFNITCGTSSSYRLRLSQTYPPTTIYATIPSTSQSFLPGYPNSLAVGVWYWSLDTLNGAVPSTKQTPVWQFTVCSQTAPSQPNLVAPATGSNTTASSILFQWSAVTSWGFECGATASAEHYDLYWDINVATPTTLRNSTAANVTQVNTSIPIGNIVWQVVATNAAGLQTFSAIYTVTIGAVICNPINPLPSSLAGPLPGSFQMSSVTLAWKSAAFGNTCNLPPQNNTYILSLDTIPSSINFVTTLSYNVLSFQPTASLLTPGNIYVWQVATSNGNSSALSNSSTFCVPTNPSAISLASPASTSQNQPSTVSLQWNTPANWGNNQGCNLVAGSESFQIYVDTVSNPAVVIASGLPNGTTSYSYTAATTGVQTYYWQIVAFNGFFNSSSPVWSFTVCVISTPTGGNPTLPAAGAVNVASTPTLVWSAAAFNNSCAQTSTYRIYLSSTLPLTTVIAEVPSTTTTYTIPAPLANGLYYFAVQPTNGPSNIGSISATSNFSVCIVSAPSAFALNTPTQGQNNLLTSVPVTFNWTATASFGNVCAGNGSNVYLLYVDAQPNPSTLVYSGTATQFTQSLVQGSFSWKVVATNGAGLSTASTEIRTFIVKVPCTPSAPTVPSLLGPAVNSLVSATSATLSWGTISFGLTCGVPQANDVILLLSSSNPPVNTTIDLVSSTAVQYATSAAPLSQGVMYFWQVNATNGQQNSLSVVWRFCVLANPAVVTMTSPSTTASPALLQWSAPLSWGDNQGCGNGARTFSIMLNSSTTPMATVASGLSAATLSYSISLPTNGVYFWAVVVSNGIYSTTTAPQSFQVCNIAVPTAPTLLSPADGAPFQTTTPTLSWNPSNFGSSCGSVSTYVVYLGQTNPPTTVVSSQNSSLATLFTVSTPSLAVGLWYWSVSARNGASADSGLGTVFSFTVCVVVPPQLSPVFVPAANITQSGTSPIIWGVVAPGIACDGSTPVLNVYLSTQPLATIETTTPVLVQTGLGNVASGSYTPSPALANGFYNAKVVLQSGAATVSVSTSFFVCTVTAPTAPVLIPPPTVSAATPYVYNIPPPALSWQPATFGNSCNNAGASSYQVLLSQAAQPGLYATVTVDTTSLTVPGLTTGTWYWQVVSVNAAGRTAASAVSSFPVCQINNPTNPVLRSPVTNTFVRGPDVNVTWLSSVDFTGGSPCASTCPGGQNEYYMIVSPQSVYSLSQAAAIVPAPAEGTTVQITTASVYYFVLAARSCFGTTSYSIPNVVYVCLDEPPTAPALVSPVAASTVGTSVQISWQVPQLGIVCHVDGAAPPVAMVRIYIGLSPARMREVHSRRIAVKDGEDDGRRRGGLEMVASLPLSLGQSYVFSNLSQGSTYFWKIEVDNGVLSTPSDVQNFTTIAHGCPYLQCNPLHSTCDTMSVTPNCTCAAGFAGATCSQVVCADGSLSPAGSTTCAGALSKSMVGVVVGPVIGVAGLCLLSLLFMYVRRKKQQVEEEQRREHAKMVLTAEDYSKYAFAMPKRKQKMAFQQASMDVEAWRHFVNLLNPWQEEFVVCQAILEAAPATELDQVSRSLIFVLEYRRLGLEYVKYLITQEVIVAMRPNTLFRGNSPASKSYVSYVRIPCLPYLFRTLALIVREIIQLDASKTEKDKAVTKMEQRASRRASRRISMQPGSPVEMSVVVDTRSEALYSGNVELDPNKIKRSHDGNEEDAEDTSALTSGVSYENVLALSLLCQRFITAIKKSAKNVPPEMRSILVHVKYCVDARFGNNRNISAKAIGSHLLLRLINPAILLPESYGVSPVTPSAEARRQLLLVTKVLQNLTNGVRFGSKEQHMSPMNDFLDNNQEGWYDFLLDLGNPDHLQVDGDGRVTTFLANGSKAKGGEEYKTTVDEGDDGPLTVPEDIYLAHTTYLATFVKECHSRVVDQLCKKFEEREQNGSAAVERLDHVMNMLPSNTE